MSNNDHAAQGVKDMEGLSWRKPLERWQYASILDIPYTSLGYNLYKLEMEVFIVNSSCMFILTSTVFQKKF